jgi:hypothetical protein
MLQPANSKAKECYDRATRARQRALDARDAQERQDHLDAEQRWLRLAQSYDLSARLDDFLESSSEPKHPRCTACAVPMWLVDVQRIPGDPPRERRYYECKVCDAKLVLLDGNEETA